MAINALIRGDYDRPAAIFRHTIDIDPDWTRGYIKLGRTLSLQKNARKLSCRPQSRSAELPAALRLFRDRGSVLPTRTAETLRARQKLAELCAIEAKRYVDPATFAGVHASLGEMDEALRWYQKALEDRSPDMVYAMVSSRITPQLAGNAGYQAIVGRMAFPRPAK